MDNVQKPLNQINGNRNTKKVSSKNGHDFDTRLLNAVHHSDSKTISNNIANHVLHTAEEPTVLDLSVYDDCGNRTVPICRHSVKFKFGDRNDLQLLNQQRTNSLQIPNYLVMVDSANLESRLTMWRPSLLDDDIITVVMNKLQTLYPNALFVNPCLTQCILFAKVKQVPLFLDPLATNKYSSIFFVLNDSHRPGSRNHHWSLLVYSRQENRLFHFDSMHNTNYRVAYELAQKLCEYLNVWTITDVSCEQQSNSTDCGYFVIDYMMKLLYMMRNEIQMPLSQINKLPSLIKKTKNFVANLYMKTKIKNQ